MKLSDYLIKTIYSETKTDKIFGYIGGMIAHIVDSIYQNKDVEMINTITEQGAGFAAEGYARVNNKLGIAIATSGPGATNLVTPIANCYFDSSPVLFITGQVNTYEYRKYDIKQCGFQETNIVDIVKPITKYTKLITNAEDIRYELEKAINIAMSGRKGPVLLDIPMDIQRAEIQENSLRKYSNIENANNNYSFDISILENSSKPLVLVGNGVNLSNADEELKEFLQTYSLPVVETIHGIDTVDFNYENNLGLIGTYGDRYGNLALYDCDLLLVLGARLDIRQTGSKVDFMNNKKIIHVDIDNSELQCDKFKKIKIHADIKEFLQELNSKKLNINCKKWLSVCQNLKKEFSHENKNYSTPNIILDKIFENIKENDKITYDVGQNQIWTAQSLQTKKGQRAITSGGLGCMGFALPAAIGASYPKNKVYAFVGDGGMQMNIQELETIKRRNLPIKIFVLNNKSLGMVKTFQDLYFEGRNASTVYDYSAPDFVKVANAYGIKALSLNTKEFEFDKISELLSNDEPALVEINFDIGTVTEPRLEFGNSIENASPIIDKEHIELVLRGEK